MTDEPREAGRCAACGRRDGRTEMGYVWCAVCFERGEERRRKQYGERRERKCCIRCGGRDFRTKHGGKLLCERCHRRIEEYRKRIWKG